ncbi:hypothetical protein BABINDRAFT_163684 [Babjeviella inositovora NRRL Y-12698]|uniref:Mandelate racemase/muconate lactonizing enzyme C-terminal domain-containing protein n=1 Tax=Babjeviella inositovora NRRL Y-12698 TaxID=984486 RepID=A0A1E3QJC2_9ASCO|nr:uncharacterized protein BABINDRAFT_163684 [Babjeviella inositovora NRRL Y-12698]ODQ77172.1 hypothetical protein BABINDRAFT_163684 [Babjeviella inositovora NRRL Y-12698]
MPTVITGYTIKDLRFPTSLSGDGSDAMNKDGDYSSAYIILHTDNQRVNGHGMTFTIGRGNDIVCYAMQYFGERLKGKALESLVTDIGATWRDMVSDSQLRWIGPEKGVIHLALGACVNAIWDMWAKSVEKPLWRLVADFTPEELVSCVDWRYLTDALTPEEAVAMLKKTAAGKEERIVETLANRAVPTYTTSAGWLGYSDEKMQSLLTETMNLGFKHFKVKVGGNLARDQHRLKLVRDIIGYDSGNQLMIDANQVWSVPKAIEYVKQLAEFKPWFIEEPTSPDDILGHLAIKKALLADGIKVATGEMCQNRTMFKQFLASGAIDICQVDSCRLGGVNEVLAVLLLAKKFNVPVVPHSGGVGLPEYTQHLSTIDYVVISGEKSILEYVTHLHEWFKHPSEVDQTGHIITPLDPGYSVEVKPEAFDIYEFPTGSFWTSPEADNIEDKIILNGGVRKIGEFGKP